MVKHRYVLLCAALLWSCSSAPPSGISGKGGGHDQRFLHVCDSGGQPTGSAKVTGAASSSGWPNLGMLQKAGIAGVKAVSPTILISFHLDKGNNYSASKMAYASRL